MIVRMSKVEIVGPKEHLLSVLSLLRELGVFQIEPDISGFIPAAEEPRVRSLLLDEKTLAERIFFEDLKAKLDALFACLPMVAVRESYLEPLSVLDAVAATVERHSAACRELHQRKELLQKELAELSSYVVFLGALESLLAKVDGGGDLEFIGVTIRDPAALEQIMRLLTRLTEGRFEVVSATADNGTVIGLIALERKSAEKVRKKLGEQHIPELTFPASMQQLPFPEKIRYLTRRIGEVAAEIAILDGELTSFAQRWGAIYRRVGDWLDERLALLKSTVYFHQTGMCFFIHGWLPSADLARVNDELRREFHGAVVVEEKKIHEEDLERIPVALRNPPYFRPFELFARLLPLPRYTSYDPTPFIAIFFPLFFGMMLGDAGHGLVVLLASLILQRVWKARRNLRDAARIMFISSLYAMLFGVFYGEFFGEFGRKLFGFKPLITERRTAITPMLLFALSVGIVHVTLGLILGVSSALKRKTVKEALFKLLNIFIILCLALLAASLVTPLPRLLTTPVIIAMLAAIPLLLISGGIMAPFELLKNVGNIISYVRIMAIGLTSVYLATVANDLAGMTGDIVTGTIVAVMLHGLGIVIGVFAPTIQSLRLQYVEFFSKFLEHGGKKFEPFRKK